MISIYKFWYVEMSSDQFEYWWFDNTPETKLKCKKQFSTNKYIYTDDDLENLNIVNGFGVMKIYNMYPVYTIRNKTLVIRFYDRILINGNHDSGLHFDTCFQTIKFFALQNRCFYIDSIFVTYGNAREVYKLKCEDSRIYSEKPGIIPLINEEALNKLIIKLIIISYREKFTEETN